MKIRLIASITSIVFILVHILDVTSLSYANTPLPASSAPSLISQIQIPEAIGKIEEIYIPESTDSNYFITYIKSTHGNTEAQENIKQIIEKVISIDKSKPVIALEGADSVLRPQNLQIFELPELQKTFIKLLSEKGELTGAELFALENPRRAYYQGVDQAELYQKNIASYRKVYGLREDSKDWFSAVNQTMSNLKSKIFSKQLKIFDKRRTAFYDTELSSDGYVSFLADWALKEAILDLNDPIEQKNFPMLTRLLALQKISPKMDKVYNFIPYEIDQLIPLFKKNKASKEWMESLSGLREGIVPQNSRDFFESLYKEVSEFKKPMDWKRFPSLRTLAQHTILFQELDGVRVFKEIRQLENVLFKNINLNRNQKALLDLSQDLTLLRQVFQLEAGREEVAYFRNRLNLLTPKTIEKRINNLSQSATRPDGHSVTALFNEASRFYQLAEKRDKVLLNNTLDALHQREAKNAILVTGGYHAEGVTQMIRSKGIPYVLISPTVKTELDNKKYQGILIKKSSNQTVEIPLLLQDFDQFIDPENKSRASNRVTRLGLQAMARSLEEDAQFDVLNQILIQLRKSILVNQDLEVWTSQSEEDVWVQLNSRVVHYQINKRTRWLRVQKESLNAFNQMKSKGNHVVLAKALGEDIKEALSDLPKLTELLQSKETIATFEEVTREGTPGIFDIKVIKFAKTGGQVQMDLAIERNSGQVMVFKRLYDEREEDVEISAASLLRKAQERTLETHGVDIDGVLKGRNVLSSVNKQKVLNFGKGHWAGGMNAYAVVYPFIPGFTLKEYLEQIKERSTTDYFSYMISTIITIAKTANTLSELELPGVWDLKNRNIIVDPKDENSLIFFDYQKMRLSAVGEIDGMLRAFLVNKGWFKMEGVVQIYSISEDANNNERAAFDLMKSMREGYSTPAGRKRSVSDFIADLEQVERVFEGQPGVAAASLGRLSDSNTREKINALSQRENLGFKQDKVHGISSFGTVSPVYVGEGSLKTHITHIMPIIGIFAVNDLDDDPKKEQRVEGVRVLQKNSSVPAINKILKEKNVSVRVYEPHLLTFLEEGVRKEEQKPDMLAYPFAPGVSLDNYFKALEGLSNAEHLPYWLTVMIPLVQAAMVLEEQGVEGGWDFRVGNIILTSEKHLKLINYLTPQKSAIEQLKQLVRDTMKGRVDELIPDLDSYETIQDLALKLIQMKNVLEYEPLFVGDPIQYKADIPEVFSYISTGSDLEEFPELTLFFVEKFLMEHRGKLLYLTRIPGIKNPYIFKKVIGEDYEREEGNAMAEFNYALGDVDFNEVLRGRGISGSIYQPHYFSFGLGYWSTLEPAMAIVYEYVPGQTVTDHLKSLTEVSDQEYLIRGIDIIVNAAQIAEVLIEYNLPGPWDLEFDDMIWTPNNQLVLIDYMNKRASAVGMLSATIRSLFLNRGWFANRGWKYTVPDDLDPSINDATFQLRQLKETLDDHVPGKNNLDYLISQLQEIKAGLEGEQSDVLLASGEVETAKANSLGGGVSLEAGRVFVGGFISLEVQDRNSELFELMWRELFRDQLVRGKVVQFLKQRALENLEGPINSLVVRDVSRPAVPAVVFSTASSVSMEGIVAELLLNEAELALVFNDAAEIKPEKLKKYVMTLSSLTAVQQQSIINRVVLIEPTYKGQSVAERISELASGSDFKMGNKTFNLEALWKSKVKAPYHSLLVENPILSQLSVTASSDVLTAVEAVNENHQLAFVSVNQRDVPVEEGEAYRFLNYIWTSTIAYHGGFEKLPDYLKKYLTSNSSNQLILSDFALSQFSERLSQDMLELNQLLIAA